MVLDISKSIELYREACDYIVSANLKRPKADGIAWPNIAGYNDHILVKGKDASVECANALT